ALSRDDGGGRPRAREGSVRRVRVLEAPVDHSGPAACAGRQEHRRLDDDRRAEAPAQAAGGPAGGKLRARSARGQGISLRIILNGDPFETAGPLSVSNLLAQLDVDARRVAVEHNLIVLKRAAFDSTEVRDGDQIEIVNFVGGGEWTA